MDTLEKLQKLGAAAAWDSCGGVKQKSLRKAGIPASYSSFIHDCAATAEQCKLVKVLQSNACIHDCKYCVNSCSKQKKLELEPAELAKSFTRFARTGMVQGLFLSSAVTGDAEKATGKIIDTARILRQRHRFKGYLHLKVLPTTPKDQVFELARYANRLSLNLEVPGKKFFSELSSTKDYKNDLQKRLMWIDEAKGKGLLQSFTTQLILGAAGETDLDVLGKMNWLYDNTGLHRTYFSAFQPIKGTGMGKGKAEKPGREHQLYQADWLMRIYDFSFKEVKLGLNEENNFGNARDIKFQVALNNPNLFPVDVNNATKEELLRVPGIGPKGAERIVEMREEKKFKEFKELRKAGAITRRAQAFIEVERQRQEKILSFF